MLNLGKNLITINLKNIYSFDIFFLISFEKFKIEYIYRINKFIKFLSTSKHFTGLVWKQASTLFFFF